MNFENKDLTLKYSENWEEKAQEIENCLLIIDHKKYKIRIMLIKYPDEAVNIDYLKSAIEIFPRDDNLKIEDSYIKNLGNKKIHKLIATNPNAENKLKTISIGLINKKDVYIFNYISFNLDEENEEFEEIIKNLVFKK